MKDNRRRTDKTHVIIGIKLIKIWAKQTSLQVQVHFLNASLAPSHATQGAPRRPAIGR